MTPQERDLLTRFLDDLVRANPGPKDAEAAGQIDRTLRSNPDAAYVLVQHAILADAALRDAEAQAAQLQRRLDQQGGAGADAQGQAQPSFLGSLFGQARPNPQGGAQGGPPVGTAGPWGAPAGSSAPPTAGYGAPYPPQTGSGVFSGGGGLGSFLRTAGTTVAGVAGGAFLFEGLRDMFGGGDQMHGFGGFGGFGGDPGGGGQMGFADGGIDPGVDPGDAGSFDVDPGADDYT